MSPSAASPVTATDLARFRVLFALYGLLTLPSFAWVADYPDAVFSPPLGLMTLFNGLPPAWFLHALQVVVTAGLLALLTGYRVMWAAWTITIAMLLGFGFTYSVGKIDHNILFVLTPAVLASARWSGHDAVRSTVMRLWAFIVSLGLLAAGLGKIEAGWLDPTTQAVRASLVAFARVADRSGPAGDLALDATSSPLLWETLDVTAVVLECGLVVSVLSWPWFRRAIAALCVFHLAVWALFGIAFTANVIAYAAFVPFGRLSWWPQLRRRDAVLLGSAALPLSATNVEPVLDRILLGLAAAIASWYLVTTARRPRAHPHA